MIRSLARGIGAWDSRRREMDVVAGVIATNEQGPPVGYVHGRTRLRGTYIHPHFERTADPITQKVETK